MQLAPSMQRREQQITWTFRVRQTQVRQYIGLGEDVTQTLYSLLFYHVAWK